jgi:hypothetical protein
MPRDEIGLREGAYAGRRELIVETPIPGHCFDQGPADARRPRDPSGNRNLFLCPKKCPPRHVWFAQNCLGGPRFLVIDQPDPATELSRTSRTPATSSMPTRPVAARSRAGCACSWRSCPGGAVGGLVPKTRWRMSGSTLAFWNRVGKEFPYAVKRRQQPTKGKMTRGFADMAGGLQYSSTNHSLKWPKTA